MSNGAPRRQRELIDAAAKIFYQKGYAASSIQEIADEVGLLKGSLYHYIRTKEDFLFAVAEDAHKASMQLIDQLKSLPADPAAELAAFVRAHLDLLIRERMKLSVYLHESRMLTPEHRQVVGEHRRLYGHYLQSLIGRGINDGVFSTSADPEFVTLAVLGMLNWTYEWYRDESHDRQKMVTAFVQTVLQSVGVEESIIAELAGPPTAGRVSPDT